MRSVRWRGQPKAPVELPADEPCLQLNATHKSDRQTVLHAHDAIFG